MSNLYHFTTQKGFENIRRDQKLYVSNPITELDRRANISVDQPANAQYISFTSFKDFHKGYAGNRLDRYSPDELADEKGIKDTWKMMKSLKQKAPKFKLTFNKEELEQYGLLVPVNYLDCIDADYYFRRIGTSDYLQWLTKKKFIVANKDTHFFQKSTNPNTIRLFSEGEWRLYPKNGVEGLDLRTVKWSVSEYRSAGESSESISKVSTEKVQPLGASTLSEIANVLIPLFLCYGTHLENSENFIQAEINNHLGDALFPEELKKISKKVFQGLKTATKSKKELHAGKDIGSSLSGQAWRWLTGNEGKLSERRQLGVRLHRWMVKVAGDVQDNSLMSEMDFLLEVQECLPFWKITDFT